MYSKAHRDGQSGFFAAPIEGGAPSPAAGETAPVTELTPDERWAKPAASIWAAARMLSEEHLSEQTKERLLDQMRASAEALALTLARNARAAQAS